MFCCGAGGGSTGDEKFKVMEGRWNINQDAIGEGGFGTVHLCVSLKTGKHRAIKAMRLANDLDREDFRNEVKVLKEVKTHRNICHIVDSGEDVRFGYLVMQSCTGGELFDRIAARKCTERDAAMAVVDVLSALNFIHQRHILHRDLKPENLLYKDKAPGAPLKLIDFGLAMKLHPKERCTEVCGTTSYMAPEVLHGNYATECDIWSLGVITYFMLSGTLPFPGRNDDEKEQKILLSEQKGVEMRGKYWDNVSNDAKDFVKSLLIAKPRKRMTGKQALSHKWIANRANASEDPLGDEIANSLKRYADAHKFEKAVRHQMATHMTTSELHRLRNVFEKLDAEGTGCVSIDALMKAIKEDAADAKTAETLAGIDLSSFDLDGDGQIDWQEFVAGAMHDHELYNEVNLDKVFHKLDINGDGTLCQREVASVLGDDHEFSRELLEKIKNERGESGSTDLAMTIDEFKKMMMDKQGQASTAEKTRAKKRQHHAPIPESNADKV